MRSWRRKHCCQAEKKEKECTALRHRPIRAESGMEIGKGERWFHEILKEMKAEEEFLYIMPVAAVRYQ